MTRRFVAWCAADLVPLLTSTWRWETHGAHHLAELRRRREGHVCVFWHADLLPLLWFHRRAGTTILASGHADGRLLARTAERWGYRVVSGSSTRGGRIGFHRLLDALRAGNEVAIAADGPRGPRRRAKPGAALAALRTGTVVVPVAARASSAWRLRSWDGFLIPRPFARVRISYGEPFRMSPRADARQAGRQAIEAGLASLETIATC